MLDDIKKTLWATADKLRANMDAAKYKHLVLGLIFVEYISDNISGSFQSKRLERIAESTARVQTLAALRDALLPRLISGQLRLPEADALAALA